MLSYRLDKGIWSRVFAVPTEVVDQHMRLCSEVALKVLLLLLRHDQPLEEADLVRKIGGKATVETVRDAIAYWMEAGVISQEELAIEENTQQVQVCPGPNLVYTHTEAQPFGAAQPAAAYTSAQPVVAYIPAQPVATYTPVAEQVPQPLSVAEDPALTPVLRYIRETQGESGGEEERKIQTITKSRMRLSTQDINQMAKDDENIAYLLQESQTILNKPLNPVATDTIVSLYSYYGMSPDLVLMLLQYCITLDKDSMRYVEKVASDWIERGITTHEKAEQEIIRATQRGSVEGKIKSAFGIYDRKLITAEQKYIHSWTEEMGFDVETITIAFERTVEQKGKISFSYINGILRRWKEKGITSAAQAFKETTEKPTSGSATSYSGGGGRDASYDIGELEHMIHNRKLM